MKSPPFWSTPAWGAIATGYPREDIGVYEDLAAHAPRLHTFELPLQLNLALNPLFGLEFSLIKAASFGLAVTLIGCYYGFNTSGGADGVGRSTTQAVVVSSMLILVLDAFWAMALL